MSPKYRFTQVTEATDETDAAIVSEVLVGAIRDERNEDVEVDARFERIDASDVDIRVRDEGTLVLFWPISEAGKAFFDEKVADGPTFGGAIVVEHRYAQDIIDGATADGLVFGGVS